uniref:Decapping nuclease n=2 Tax=Stomoxys calcitrans TaxID=35570 RepID=A0A1I8PJP6_STOCA
MSSVEVSSTSTLNYHKRSAIYTGRRVLTKIMQWCYEKKFDFHVLVSRYNGNLYMAGDRSWEGIPSNVHHKRFEQLLFADSPEKPPNCDEPINENITQSVLHRCKLGNYEILYAGEAQGIISEEKIENLDDMEALDKCRFVFTKQLWANVKDKENKFLTYWIQSYLSAIDDIYVGYKSFGGFVETPIECMKISDMPRKYSWDPAVCFGFLNYFLEQVEQLMSKVNCLHTVYEFTFRVRDKATVYEIYEGNSDKSFIPQFYADFVARGSPMETNDETN